MAATTSTSGFSSSAGGLWGKSDRLQSDWLALSGPAFIKNKPFVSPDGKTYVGPMGPRGPPGLQGLQGIPGLQGIQGPPPPPESVADKIKSEVTALVLGQAAGIVKDFATEALAPYLAQAKNAIAAAVKAATSSYAVLQEVEVAVTAAEEATVAADAAIVEAETAAVVADTAAALADTAAATDAAIGTATAAAGAAAGEAGLKAGLAAGTSEAAQVGMAAGQAGQAAAAAGAVEQGAEAAANVAGTAATTAANVEQAEVGTATTAAKGAAEVGKDAVEGVGTAVKDVGKAIGSFFGLGGDSDPNGSLPDGQPVELGDDPNDPSDGGLLGTGTALGSYAMCPQPDWNATGTWPQYGAILNKPVANYGQTDSTKPDFIKNKPDLSKIQLASDWNAQSGVNAILNKPSIYDIVDFLYGAITVIARPLDVQGDLTVQGNLVVKGNAKMSGGSGGSNWVALQGGVIMNFGSFQYYPSQITDRITITFQQPYTQSCLSCMITPGDNNLMFAQQPTLGVSLITKSVAQVRVISPGNLPGVLLTGYYQALGI